MSRFMISNTEFYDRLLKLKESETALKEREIIALETIAESLKEMAKK